MADTLTLRIVTPERIVLEQEVDEVVARAIDGELAILPHHQPLLTPLAIDIVRYKDDSGDATAAVIGGIMEVANNEVTILSDLAELDTEVDEARAHQRKGRAEAEKTQRVDKLDVYLAEMALAKSIARLKAAELAKQRMRSRQRPS
ncbi:MAG: ATP synthase F1 subunit epsilon [Candidatus Melainabacteria bacterium]|nr:ATP synthase F1 subunit epsilon [Candidatus Melainabacteria bacterium]